MPRNCRQQRNKTVSAHTSYTYFPHTPTASTYIWKHSHTFCTWTPKETPLTHFENQTLKVSKGMSTMWGSMVPDHFLWGSHTEARSEMVAKLKKMCCVARLFYWHCSQRFTVAVEKQDLYACCNKVNRVLWIACVAMWQMVYVYKPVYMYIVEVACVYLCMSNHLRIDYSLLAALPDRKSVSSWHGR